MNNEYMHVKVWSCVYVCVYAGVKEGPLHLQSFHICSPTDEIKPTIGAFFYLPSQ